jgi:hypothetical protein
MPQIKLQLGETLDTINKHEMAEVLRKDRLEEAQRTAARGVKYARLNPPVTGQAAGGVLQMGGDFPNTGPGGTVVQPPGPRAGYAWAIRSCTVQGLTAGATPDVVNLYRRSGGRPIWTFTGGPAVLTAAPPYMANFSFGEKVFLEGETPVLVSVGAFAATGIITFDMDFVETPQELLWKALI